MPNMFTFPKILNTPKIVAISFHDSFLCEGGGVTRRVDDGVNLRPFSSIPFTRILAVTSAELTADLVSQQVGVQEGLLTELAGQRDGVLRRLLLRHRAGHPAWRRAGAPGRAGAAPLLGLLPPPLLPAAGVLLNRGHRSYPAQGHPYMSHGHQSEENAGI